jgi:hypothetical protein
MGGPTPDQIALIRQYEPALYFSGAPGAPGSERFFPSDAKRYLEQAALYLAKAPFATRADWGTPVGFAGQLGAINGEGAIFLGQFNEAGTPQYPFLETVAGQEHFLDVSGWTSNDTRADLDRLASLYATNQALSQFWYHAEFFDTPRLQNLFTELVRSGSALNFNNLFGSTPGNPPVLTNPALICYYLFYPAHEESLSGCEYAPGQIVDTARDFASFAGEWSCIALLLDRPNAAAPYAPKWAGLSNRNVGKTSVNGEEVRSTMRILPWAGMDLYQVTHPRLFVGRGSHGLYLPDEMPPPLTFADPSAAFCGGATSLTTGPVGAPSAPLYGIATGFLIDKVIAGSAAGTGLLGFPGGAVGAAAGLVWGIAEIANAPRLDGVDPPETPALQSTIDTTGSNGIVIHPKGLPPPGVDPGNTREWQSDDNVVIGGRKYFFTVDRTTQVLWGNDPDGQGYTGRWGAHVAQDPQTRRSGMAFPTFWQLFFETLVRNDLPAVTIALKTGKTVATWTVPHDWNAKNNTVECIGGGVGGGTSVAGGAFAAGGGGAYSKSVNLTWSPGQVINFSVGAGADNLGTAGDTYVNPAGPSFPTSGEAAGARGATSSNGGSSANGYATGIGNVKNAGGNGGTSSWGGGGGGGAGGANGIGAVGGSTGLGGTAGSGGGGAGGGTAGGSTTTDDNPGTGGAGSGGSGVGGKGAAVPTGTADPGANGTDLDGAHGSGGGGGGGAGDDTGNITATTGADGGRYGGGGGAGGSSAGIGGIPGGKGADGIIVIRYVPLS